jgi:uncharacterized membrane protein YdjX (TVP38/TMEM64 family)
MSVRDVNTEEREFEDIVEGRERLRLPLKPILIFFVLALCLIVVMCSPLKGYLKNVEAVKAQLRTFGMAGPIVFVAAGSLLIACGFPRLLFCPIGGMAFGFVEGLIWTQLASMIGYYLLFLFVRWGGRGFVLRHWPRLTRVDKLFKWHPVPSIILIRQTPISGMVINLILAVSPVRHRHFLIGTLLGLLPEAIPFTLVGSSAGKVTAGEGLFFVVAGTVALVLFWLALAWISRSSKVFAGLRNEMNRTT